MDFLNKIFRGDRVIWMVFLFLCLISIVEVYSASSRLTFRTDYWKPILYHSAFLLGGLVVVLLVHVIPSRFFSIIGIFEKGTNFLDLAKLTLGAFIGSFLQRTHFEIQCKQQVIQITDHLAGRRPLASPCPVCVLAARRVEVVRLRGLPPLEFSGIVN